MILNSIKKISYLTVPIGLLVAKYTFAALKIPATDVDSVETFFGKMCKLGDYFFTFIMIIAIIMFLVAAFTFLTAGDSAEGQKRAKNFLIYGIVGVVVALMPKAIIAITANFFGVSAGFNACP